MRKPLRDLHVYHLKDPPCPCCPQQKVQLSICQSKNHKYTERVSTDTHGGTHCTQPHLQILANTEGMH